MAFNLGYAKASYIDRNETQEPPEPWTSSGPRTHEDSSPNWGAGMPETSSVISLTGQNHINTLIIDKIFNHIISACYNTFVPLLIFISNPSWVQLRSYLEEIVEALV
jgi:hypothetical protein